MSGEACAFCGRTDAPKMHRHHTTPRSKGGKETVPTCGCCGSFIHATWSHNELRDVYNMVERIKADERFRRYLGWLRKQDAEAHFRTRRRNGRAQGKYR